jgi:glycine dehydrogenase subunit 1
MRYLPKSESERREMLEAIGVANVEELFACIPPEARLNRELALPPGRSEFEIMEYFKDRARENAPGFQSFLGAGVYHHLRPVVADHLISRSEFYSAYTPYQPEVAQGTLQAIFEFQTMICQLTGMDVANASMYDGSSALPEAVMMAARVTGRRKALVSRAVHPEYRQVLATYAKHQDMKVKEFGWNAESGAAEIPEADDKTAAVVIQSPNFFGVIEDVAAAAEKAHAAGALLIMVVSEPISLGLLRAPAEADIVILESQGFGLPPSYGGPYAGVIATREQYVRQMPGRLAGQTVDTQGRRGFCLTLSTREQHIRREKATSNICTNQSLFMLMATIFMTIYGKRGLRDLAARNVSQSHYVSSKLPLRFSGAHFNEFVVRASAKQNRALLKKKVIGGLELKRFYPELKDCLLVCVTEAQPKWALDALLEAYGS